MGSSFSSLRRTESSLTVSETSIGPAASAADASGLSFVGAVIAFSDGLSGVPVALPAATAKEVPELLPSCPPGKGSRASLQRKLLASPSEPYDTRAVWVPKTLPDARRQLWRFVTDVQTAWGHATLFSLVVSVKMPAVAMTPALADPMNVRRLS